MSVTKRVAKKITNQKDLDEFFNLTEDDITYTYLCELFGEFNGKVRYNPYDELVVPPGYFGPEGSKLNKTIYTTLGIWIFNKYVIEQHLYHVLGYINKTLNDKGHGEINQTLTYAMLEGKITVEDKKLFHMKMQKLQPFAAILSPSMTEKMLFCTKVIEKKKKELMKKYEKEIKAGDVNIIANMQKELLDYAREYLKDDPSMDLFNSGARGSFDNNFKDMFVMKGAILNQDPNAKKEYEFAFSSYMTGISKEEYNTFANALVAGPFYRAGKTQAGGYWEKLFRNAFQHIVLLEKGSDCGTKDYIEIDFNTNSIKDFMYCFVIENDGSLTEITSENMDKFKGKKVKMRFPNMCKAKNGKCNMCTGNLPYRLGIKNIGVALTKIPSTMKNICMKNFHDSQVKLTEIDPMEMFSIDK